MKSKIICSLLAFFTLFDALFCATTITENKQGTIDGLNYELWKDSGTTSMTLNGGGKFSCSWSNINNALFRIGKKFGSTKKYSEYGSISFDFAADYQPNGNSYLCVYGWTQSPLIEYYIVESWGTWRPPGSGYLSTVTVDGDSYDIYVTTRTNQPSIEGTTTFKQYWSVRQSKRSSGTIAVHQHFKQWENLGLSIGKLYEAALNVEGYQSSGTANIYKNTLTIGGSDSSSSSSSSGSSSSGVTYEKDSWTSSSTMTITDKGSGAFTASWSGTNGWGRFGSVFSSKKSYKNLYLDYAVKKYSIDSGSSSFAVYGLVYDDSSKKYPLNEFFIVPYWKNWRPNGNGASSVGSVTVGGKVYDLYSSGASTEKYVDGVKYYYLQTVWCIAQESVAASSDTSFSGTLAIGSFITAFKNQGIWIGDELRQVSLQFSQYESKGQATVTKNVVRTG